MDNPFLSNFCIMSNNWLKELYNSKEKQIYHYTSQDALLSILKNKTLRFSDRFYLNDKTEGIYTLSLMIDELERIIPEGSLLAGKKEEIRKVCQEYLECFRENNFNVYQCSFSMSSDSLPLWNYYTKNNEMHGINIEFDSKELAKSIEENLPRADGIDANQRFVLGGQIIYDVGEQIDIIRKYIIEYEKVLRENLQNEDIIKRKSLRFFSRVLDRIVLAGTFFKAQCFSYEQEYRLAVYLCSEDGKFIALNNAQVAYVSRYDFYLPHIDLFFDLSCIKAIAMSPTYDFENLKNNMTAMLKSFGVGDDVKIVQSQIPVRY